MLPSFFSSKTGTEKPETAQEDRIKDTTAQTEKKEEQPQVLEKEYTTDLLSKDLAFK